MFSPEAIRAATHLNCVGTDTKGKRELPAGILRRSRLFGGDREQSRSIGEGQRDSECPSIGIGDMLVGTTERDFEDVTVIDMAGLALQDLVVALAPRHRKRSRHDPVVSTRQLMAISSRNSSKSKFHRVCALSKAPVVSAVEILHPMTSPASANTAVE